MPPRAIAASLARHAREAPDAALLIDASGACSRARLHGLVDRQARRLAISGVRAGDRVAVIADRRVATIACLLGAMRAGAVAVPVNPRLLPGQVRHVLVDSGAVALAGTPRALAALDDVAASLPALIRLDASMPGDPPGADDADGDTVDGRDAEGAATDRPAAILYTSGSTADPKGVVLSAANLAYGADSVATFLELGPDDRLLALLPLSFDYGLNQVLSAIYVGACAVLVDAPLPRDVVDAVVEHRVTGVAAVPHLWNRLARLSWPDVPHLRYATSTGGHLPAATSERLRAALPRVRFHAMYGFTEAFRATALDPDLLASHPDSVGTAVPHARVLIVDETGTETAPGETGELIQSGPLVTLGYWRADEASRARFRPRPAPHDDGTPWAWSGDLFRRDADGLLYFVSRRDDVAKLHGYRVNPAEIERVLAGCPGVRDACVVCVPHPTLGEAAVAILAADDGALDAIRAHARSALPAFMRPEALFTLETLPAGPHGKTDRRALREAHRAVFDGADSAGTRRR